MAMNKEVLSALIGLVGAINNNGRTETTDSIIRNALLGEPDDSCIDEIHQEKFKISPGCATCQSPCGNTSDYPMESFDEWTTEQRNFKERIYSEILRIVENGNADSELPEIVLKGIAYIGYNLKEESYRNLLDEMTAL